MRVIVGILFLFLIACVKDKPNPSILNMPLGIKKMMLINEGSYGNNNGDFSLFDFEQNTIVNNIFQQKYNQPLGDVVQHVIYDNNNFYFAVNNSNKIEVVAANFLSKHSIYNIQYPQYFQAVNDSILYVSSLYNSFVYVINKNTYEVVKKIATPYTNTQHMILQNGFVWLTIWNKNCKQLYKINTSTHSIIDSISLPNYTAHDIVADKNNYLWVLSGNKYENMASNITCVNTLTKNIEKNIWFNANQDPFRLTINKTKDTLFFIQVNYTGQQTNNGLYRMSIDDAQLPTHAFIQAPTNSYFWAVGFDTISNEIYLSDPKGFNQRSSILKYNAKGNLLETYQSGIGTNQFLFY